ncbi:MAG TPA: hypothetical protein VJ852_13195, partial [Gemmatimonadaceae bacterium]|nr:hypothetical protein [Gemmatimonadaceae bacterium]
RVAPAAEVTTGTVAPIDTSRYSAVIALDATAAPYAARLSQYVRSGGGLVLAPAAAASSALAPLRAVGGDAIVLEKRGAATTISARRLGAGRLLQTVYEETWKSRMTGGDSAVAEHRRLWTGLVSDVAYPPHVARRVGRPSSDPPDDDPTPFAALVASIGRLSTAQPTALSAPDRAGWGRLLFAMLAFAMVLEVASRRSRGMS